MKVDNKLLPLTNKYHILQYDKKERLHQMSKATNALEQFKADFNTASADEHDIVYALEEVLDHYENNHPELIDGIEEFLLEENEKYNFGEQVMNNVELNDIVWEDITQELEVLSPYERICEVSGYDHNHEYRAIGTIDGDELVYVEDIVVTALV